MFNTRDDYTAYYEELIAKVEFEIWIEKTHAALVREYSVYRDEQFKFLAEMPFEQGRDWVKKMVDLYSELNAADPERYPVVTRRDMALAVKAYRKSKKQKKQRSSVRPNKRERAEVREVAEDEVYDTAAQTPKATERTL